MGVADRLKHAWNAFRGDPTPVSVNTGPSSFYRPDRPRLTRGNDRSLVAAIFNRIAMDAAALDIEHVQLDDEKRYVGTINSGLNNCLTLEANIDQTGRAFIQDVVFIMLDKGNVALVPTDTDVSPIHSGGYDILSMRAGEIVEWYPQYVKVSLYNEKTGRKDEQTFPKRMVSIVENPLYATINQPNSTLQRLLRKLVLIDAVDEETSSGKLNMIIQLPYIIKTEARKQQAENRRKDIEDQLRNSKYGVAYADGTEKIMQLNRPLENDLLSQIEYLTNLLYAQLGITDAVMNGTASEEEMQNYYSRTIEPILSAVTDEMKRKFLTKNARTRGQSIKYFRDPFKLITISGIAEIGDTLTRNEVLTSNELRQILGLKPSDSPRADELVNKNMPIEDLGIQNEATAPVDMGDPQGDYDSMGSQLDDLDAQLDALENSLNHSDILVHKAYASPYYDPQKAHEYYMKNRELKGRGTSGLNEEGKFTAKAIKEALDRERDQKIEEHRTQTNKSIADSKNRMSSAVDQRNKQTTNAIKKNTAATNDRIRANADRTSSEIRANTNATNARVQANSQATADQISANTEQMNAELKQERDRVKSEIESHSRTMDSKIKQLQNQLSNMGPNQRKARRQEFQEKIDQLRESNAAERDKLNGAYSEFSDSKKSENKATNTKLRNDNSATNARLKESNSEKNAETRSKSSEENRKLREDNSEANSKKRESTKEENTKDRETHQEEKSKLNEEHKTKKKELKEEYSDKYDEELAKIYNNSNLLKQEKAKSSGSKGSKSSSKSGSGNRGKSSYHKRESKVKAIRKKYGV